jgi:exodeoxyribonuclease VII large subunit
VPDETPLTVAALTRRIQLSLSDFGPLLVAGELSGVKVAPSGHLYARLKDGEAVIDVVMWRSSVARQGRLPQEGERVVARGSIDVYPPRGTYQLVCSRISPAGQGDLAAQLERLKGKLAAEGLFDDERKIELPLLPRAVGLATAPGSAALADLLHSLRVRFPAMPVVLAGCQVQGRGAAASIVAAIRQLDQHPEVDVIVVGRGGGSLEDLWAFNEEPVVRAIAACQTPIVSAVGHESDWTLADLAADVRAKTPTAAGELVVPVAAELAAQVAEGRARLDAGIARLMAEARQRLAALARHRALAGPGHQVALRRQRLDELRAALDAGMAVPFAQAQARLDVARARLRPPALEPARERWRRLAADLDRLAVDRGRRIGERLAATAARLDALSPLAVLGRGYSVLRTPERRLVRHLADAPAGTVVEARVVDGWVLARVDGVRRQGLGEPEAVYG